MKRTLIIIVILLIVIITGWFIHSNEPIPKAIGVENSSVGIAPADALANKMLKAIHKEEWDAIRYVQWSFRDKTHFLWDKVDHLVQVTWDDYRVLINPNTATGIAYQDDVIQTGEEADELVGEAIDAFNNDSFWLNAPAKVYDAGTERSIVNYKGEMALMVKYSSGGTTPGDTYLWILDDNGLPIKWKMWVSIIPLGGVEFTWEGWAEYDGAMLSQYRKGALFDLRISNIKTGLKLADLDINQDVFAELRD